MKVLVTNCITVPSPLSDCSTGQLSWHWTIRAIDCYELLAMSEGKCEFPEDWVREADPKLYNEVSAALQSQVSNGPINLIASYCIEKRSYITCSPAHIDVFPRRHFQHKIADGSINYDSCFHGSADRGFASPLAYYRGLYRYCVLADLDKVNVSEVLMRVDHMQWMSQSPAFVSSDHRLYLVMTEVCFHFPASSCRPDLSRFP